MLKSKKVGGTVLGNGLQTVDYQYNIRGWMTKINDPANLGTDLFGYKINYNQVDGLENPNVDFMDLKVKLKYNGNIAEISWKTLTEENEPLKDMVILMMLSTGLPQAFTRKKVLKRLKNISR